MASETALPTTGILEPNTNFPVFRASVSALCANTPCRLISAPNKVAQSPSAHLEARHSDEARPDRSTPPPTQPVA